MDGAFFLFGDQAIKHQKVEIEALQAELDDRREITDSLIDTNERLIASAEALQADNKKLREAAEMGGGFMEGIIEVLEQHNLIGDADLNKANGILASIKSALEKK